MGDKEFYKNGLRFECTRCGACCIIHGDHAYVYLTAKNIDEMSRFLGLTPDAFYESFCRKNEDGNVILTMKDGHCNFLENNRCIVYPVRPAQCRAWPILSEHLNDTYWNGVLREFCPGIGQGRLYTAEEIENIVTMRDRER